ALSVLCLFSAVFLLLIRRRPSSPLFPYTTLFRSVGSFAAIALSIDSICPGVCLRKIRITFSLRRTLGSSADGTSATGAGGGTSEDRKSTRLNSSHVKISYAVFCLKKKRTSILTPT